MCWAIQSGDPACCCYKEMICKGTHRKRCMHASPMQPIAIASFHKNIPGGQGHTLLMSSLRSTIVRLHTSVHAHALVGLSSLLSCAAS